MKEEHKQFIENADYKTLLKRWRFGGLDDEIFLGNTGKAFSDALNARKSEMMAIEAVQISKDIGWG